MSMSFATRQLAGAIFLLGLSGLLLATAAARGEEQSPGTATSPDGKVRVEVLSLRRTEADTVTARFQVTNKSNDDYRVVPQNLRLLDMAGRRIYSPGVTPDACTTPIGQQLTCYAVFGAPPSGTKTTTVKFYEKLDLIPGVPVSE